MTDANDTAINAVDDALHAAECWLQRRGEPEISVVVAYISPIAGIGVWQPGARNVGRLPAVDDRSAEVLEAAAPVVQGALAGLKPQGRAAVANTIAAGAGLQVLLIPSAGEAVVRLVHGGSAQVLAALVREEPVH